MVGNNGISEATPRMTEFIVSIYMQFYKAALVALSRDLRSFCSAQWSDIFEIFILHQNPKKARVLPRNLLLTLQF